MSFFFTLWLLVIDKTAKKNSTTLDISFISQAQLLFCPPIMKYIPNTPHDSNTDQGSVLLTAGDQL